MESPLHTVKLCPRVYLWGPPHCCPAHLACSDEVMTPQPAVSLNHAMCELDEQTDTGWLASPCGRPRRVASAVESVPALSLRGEPLSRCILSQSLFTKTCPGSEAPGAARPAELPQLQGSVQPKVSRLPAPDVEQHHGQLRTHRRLPCGAGVLRPVLIHGDCSGSSRLSSGHRR